MTILAGAFTGHLSDAIMIDLGQFVAHVGFMFESTTPRSPSRQETRSCAVGEFIERLRHHGKEARM